MRGEANERAAAAACSVARGCESRGTARARPGRSAHAPIPALEQDGRTHLHHSPAEPRAGHGGGRHCGLFVGVGNLVRGRKQKKKKTTPRVCVFLSRVRARGRKTGWALRRPEWRDAVCVWGSVRGRLRCGGPGALHKPGKKGKSE